MYVLAIKCLIRDIISYRDEEGKPCEVLKPKLIFNPHFQRLYQVSTSGVLNAGDLRVSKIQTANL